MRPARTTLALLAPWTLLAACGRGPEADPRARVPIPVAGATYDSSDAELPRLKFPDGSKTGNDRCMVLQRKLNPKIPPIYVNGTPLGFC